MLLQECLEVAKFVEQWFMLEKGNVFFVVVGLVFALCLLLGIPREDALEDA